MKYNENWRNSFNNTSNNRRTNNTIYDRYEVDWTVDLQSSVYNQPVVCGNELYFSDNVGHVYKIDVREKEIKWKIKVNDEARNLCIENGSIYIQSNNRVSRIEASDGSLIWEQEDAPLHCCSPLVIGDTVLWGSKGFDNFVKAYDLATGSVRWTKEVAGRIDGLTKYKNTIIMQYPCPKTNNSIVEAVESIHGKSIWKFNSNWGVYRNFHNDIERLLHLSIACVAHGILYVGSAEGIYQLNPKSGDVINFYKFNVPIAGARFGFSICNDHIVYVNDMVLERLNLNNGEIASVKFDSTLLDPPIVHYRNTMVVVGGEIQILNTSDWEVKSRLYLQSQSIYSGVAVANDHIYIGGFNKFYSLLGYTLN